MTVNELNFVELSLFCADICGALDQGMGGAQNHWASKDLRDSTYRSGMHALGGWVSESKAGRNGRRKTRAVHLARTD